MPISPQEAKKRREESITDDLHFKAHCSDIDKMLAGPRHPTTNQWWWAVDGVDQAAIDAITKTYTAMGWKVTHCADARDGDYLAFDDK